LKYISKLWSGYVRTIATLSTIYLLLGLLAGISGGGNFDPNTISNSEAAGDTSCERGIVNQAEPPEGAIILLGEGKGLSEWRLENDEKGEIPWKLKDGVLQIAPKSGSIMTRRDFRDFRLHLEFNINDKSDPAGDGTGNSGIYIQRRYEVQIFDSYGKADYTYQDCGAIYKFKKTDVSACLPAGQWQSYDIIFHAPQWDAGGNKITNARITVVQNGLLIHDNVEVSNKTGAGQPEGPSDGPILLQEHGNPVAFRNIWITELPGTKQQTTHKAGAGTGGEVKITEHDDKLTVQINGKLFTEYRFKDVPRPYFYPVIGPTGEGVTRNWPMKEAADEERDHPHQRSLWFTHGDVNGNNFWSEEEGAGRIVHDKFLQITSGPEVGVIRSQNNWVSGSGEIVCTDTRTTKFYNRPEGRMMDFEITIHASHGRVTMGDTKEGSMAIRLTPTLRLKGEVGQGHIVNSESVRDGDTWGKRAAWCDYYGPVKGQIVGVAIFDHPQNPRHPTWWHVRDYGLFAANPFGIHDFENQPAGAGALTIEAGQSLTFRYRFYFHKGDEQQGKVAWMYRDYAATKY